MTEVNVPLILEKKLQLTHFSSFGSDIILQLISLIFQLLLIILMFSLLSLYFILYIMGGGRKMGKLKQKPEYGGNCINFFKSNYSQVPNKQRVLTVFKGREIKKISQNLISLGGSQLTMGDGKIEQFGQ